MGSKRRITEDVLPSIKKAYWTEAKEALRLQVGTLRFDLNTLVASKPRSEKKAALAAKKQFFDDIEKVDFAIREKKMQAAIKAYGSCVISGFSIGSSALIRNIFDFLCVYLFTTIFK